jgi:hypothetical protein
MGLSSPTLREKVEEDLLTFLGVFDFGMKLNAPHRSAGMSHRLHLTRGGMTELAPSGRRPDDLVVVTLPHLERCRQPAEHRVAFGIERHRDPAELGGLGVGDDPAKVPGEVVMPDADREYGDLNAVDPIASGVVFGTMRASAPRSRSTRYSR